MCVSFRFLKTTDTSVISNLEQKYVQNKLNVAFSNIIPYINALFFYKVPGSYIIGTAFILYQNEYFRLIDPII